MSNDVNPYDLAGVRKAMEEFRDHIEQASEKVGERGEPAAEPQQVKVNHDAAPVRCAEEDPESQQCRDGMAPDGTGGTAPAAPAPAAPLDVDDLIAKHFPHFGKQWGCLGGEAMIDAARLRLTLFANEAVARLSAELEQVKAALAMAWGFDAVRHILKLNHRYTSSCECPGCKAEAALGEKGKQ